MTSWGWFVVGMAVSVVQVLTQWWTVNRLQPDDGMAAVRWTMAGSLGRLLVTTVLLLTAFSYNITAGLLAFSGWWVGRWPLIIWWGR